MLHQNNSMIVNFSSGLGNQMFQFAFYLSIKEVYGEAFASMGLLEAHNGFELDDVFNIDIPFVEVSKDNSSMRTDSLNFNPEVFNQTSPMHFIGYWQSEKYFSEIKRKVANAFKFPEIDGSNEVYLKEILRTNSVSIHVRRGDYYLGINKDRYAGICESDYYQMAIEKMDSIVDSAKYIVFSDDVEWCKANLNVKDATFVEGNTGKNSFRDMQLMSLCKHNIIANSSFSWWAAWLNENKKKIIIAPKKWFQINTIEYNINDIIPQEWLKI